MSRLYGPAHRSLQDRFDTRKLADNVEQRVVLTKIPPEHKAFIESRDMFWLATVDHQGRPTVSYKGGDPGFVRVVAPDELEFASYDGNGQFRSLGNLLANPGVGLLFIDFESPRRLRVNGRATLIDEPAALVRHHGAQLVVRVRAERIFPNCPRYIHRTAGGERSADVPRPGHEPPAAAWKSMPIVADVLPQPRERDTPIR